MEIKDYFAFDQNQWEKVCKFPRKLIEKAWKNTKKTEEKFRETWPTSRRRAYFKACLQAYNETKPPKPVQYQEAYPIEGHRFYEMKAKLDQEVQTLSEKAGQRSAFDCQVCGLVNFHSRLACWWRRVSLNFRP